MTPSALLSHGKEKVHVPCRAPDEAECGQRGHLLTYDLSMTAERLQLIGQRAEQ